jgi:hypothetical protein
MYKEILDSIKELVKQNTSYTVVVGGNPTKESIAITGFTTPNAVYLDRDTQQNYDITINGKSGDQAQLFSDLSAIHRALTLRNDFPHSEKWQVTSIDTTASPRLLGVEEAERTRYIYGSSISVKFYALGMKGEQT